MFTIKHIQALGHETLHTTRQVRYSPGARKSNTGVGDDPDTIWFDLADGTAVPLTGGTIFVMNESGKTVARYDLGASPVPIIGDPLNDPRGYGVSRAQ